MFLIFDITNDLSSYLGVIIITCRNGKDAYAFIIDKVRSKLTGWKAKSLSFAGMITLAHSCIMSIPMYVMHSTSLPASICDEVEKLCRDFIWGSTFESIKCHLVSWEFICRPKEEGGVGFRSLRMVNTCYMMKLGWDLIINGETLWVRVTRAKYNRGNLLIPNVRCDSKVSHIWRGIYSAWNLVE